MFNFISESNVLAESEILKQNLVNFEARICQLDEKEKIESKKIENLIGRMTACENSAKDSSNKNFAELDQKVGTFAKAIEENSAQVMFFKVLLLYILNYVNQAN